jgi:hypothetical protein
MTRTGKLIVANVGDSRAVLCCDHDQQAIPVSRYLLQGCGGSLFYMITYIYIYICKCLQHAVLKEPSKHVNTCIIISLR